MFQHFTNSHHFFPTGTVIEFAPRIELTVISDDPFFAIVDLGQNGSHCVLGCNHVNNEFVLIFRQSHYRRPYKSFFFCLESGLEIRVPLEPPVLLRQRMQRSRNFLKVCGKLTIVLAEAHEGSLITHTAENRLNPTTAYLDRFHGQSFGTDSVTEERYLSLHDSTFRHLQLMAGSTEPLKRPDQSFQMHSKIG